MDEKSLITRDGRLTLCPYDTMTEYYPFLSGAWLRIQIPRFLKDVVDSLGVRNPQAIFLYVYANRVNQDPKCKSLAFGR